MKTAMQVASRLEREYKEKLNEIYFNEDGELNEDIKQFLDEEMFEFRSKDGSVELKTLGQKIKESINDVQEIDCNLFHATSTFETADKIINGGFKPQFISRTKIGPGFYFACSEGEARDYGTAVLRAHCCGSFAHMKPGYYSNINNFSNVSSKLREFAGLKSTGYPTAQTEDIICSKMLDEYCRSYMVNQLGVDFSYGIDGRTSAIVAHNLDKITDIGVYP